jgi:hypothetical protein
MASLLLPYLLQKGNPVLLKLRIHFYSLKTPGTYAEDQYKIKYNRHIKMPAFHPGSYCMEKGEIIAGRKRQAVPHFKKSRWARADTLIV